MDTFDIVIIGAGIAGVSAGAHLADGHRVCILDMEERPAYHTTGRSAASYEPNYGPAPMLAFTRASAAFFHAPPDGFAAGPLLVPRPSLFLEPEGQAAHTEALLRAGSGLQELTPQQAQPFFPVLREGYAKRAFLDPNTADMDVDLIHGGYLRLFRARGGTVMLNAAATALERNNGLWRVTTAAGTLQAPIIVNAAGPWGDDVARMAGVAVAGLTPKRRSIGVVPLHGHGDFSHWAMVTDVAETWYAKPQSGKLIVSSADATPVDPHDAYADDMAIAEGVDRLMAATTLVVDRLDHSWGGLRTFAPDGNPVIGFDPSTDGFFWLVGQGGYGIQSCPALSETAAALVLGREVPAHVLSFGLDPATISPRRRVPA